MYVQQLNDVLFVPLINANVCSEYYSIVCAFNVNNVTWIYLLIEIFIISKAIAISWNQ